MTQGNNIELERAFTGSLSCNMIINGNNIQGEAFGYIIKPYSSVTLIFRSSDGNNFANIYLDSIHLRFIKNVLETGAFVNTMFKKRISNNIIPIQFVSDENFIMFTITDQRNNSSTNVAIAKQDVASILALKSIVDELLHIMTYIEPYFAKQREQNQQNSIQQNSIQQINNNVINSAPPAPQQTIQPVQTQQNTIGNSPNPFVNSMNNSNGVI